MTVDNWIEPTVPSPWLLLILPGGYLLIGAWRHTLDDRRVLAVQLAGFAAYLVLAVTALSVDEGLTRYLVAAGWIAHAGWDVVHHRANAVVPRAYAEWCGGVDLVVGITILATWS